jgi:hypothetical protein
VHYRCGTAGLVLPALWRIAGDATGLSRATGAIEDRALRCVSGMRVGLRLGDSRGRGIGAPLLDPENIL